MTTIHEIPTTKTESSDWDKGCFKSPAIIMLEGNKRGKYTGFSVGGWDHTGKQRVIHAGPFVQGPQAYMNENCGVMDQNGGTGRINREAKEAGLLFEVKQGDALKIDGVVYEISVDRYGYPTLSPRVK